MERLDLQGFRLRKGFGRGFDGIALKCTKTQVIEAFCHYTAITGPRARFLCWYGVSSAQLSGLPESFFGDADPDRVQPPPDGGGSGGHGFVVGNMVIDDSTPPSSGGLNIGMPQQTAHAGAGSGSAASAAISALVCVHVRRYVPKRIAAAFDGLMG